MSAAWERAMGALELDPETGDKVEPPKRSHEGRCWRCLKNPSRVSGEDYTCEPCFAWISGETDEDPRGPKIRDSCVAWEGYHHVWYPPAAFQT